jgi:hypothetical protein
MKTKLQTHSLKIAASVGLLAALSFSAKADLVHYYQFSTGSGNDQVGSANGTLLNGAAITGGALVTAGGNGTVSGQWGGSGPMMTLNSSAVSGITGAFTIVDWFTCTTGWPKYDGLYAFSDGSQNNYLLATPVRNESNWPSGVGFVGGGGLTRSQISTWDMVVHGIYLDTPGPHQTILTYDGTTFSYYVDGQLANFSGYAATMADPGFNLSTLTDIGINGGSPYGDPALTGSTYSFGIFNHSLTTSDVSALYGLGSNPTSSQIVAAVPEPSILALTGVALFGSIVARRKFKA